MKIKTFSCFSILLFRKNQLNKSPSKEILHSQTSFGNEREIVKTFEILQIQATFLYRLYENFITRFS